MFLLCQYVVLDVADSQRAVAPDQSHYLAHIRRGDRIEPSMTLTLVQLHRRNKEADIARRHIGQRVSPVFQYSFVDALGMTQIGSPVVGNPGPQHVMMRALDDVNGVDLHIAEVLDRGGGRGRPGAKRYRCVEPLGVQPDAPRLKLGQGTGFIGGGHTCRAVAGFVTIERYGFSKCQFKESCFPEISRHMKKPRHPKAARRKATQS